MQPHLAPKTQFINVQRFGSAGSGVSQSGASRLNDYLLRLRFNKPASATNLQDGSDADTNHVWSNQTLSLLILS